MPWFLVKLGLAAKPERDCGDHDWYKATQAEEHCYHCTVGRRSHTQPG